MKKYFDVLFIYINKKTHNINSRHQYVFVTAVCGVRCTTARRVARARARRRARLAQTAC